LHGIRCFVSWFKIITGLEFLTLLLGFRYYWRIRRGVIESDQVGNWGMLAYGGLGFWWIWSLGATCLQWIHLATKVNVNDYLISYINFQSEFFACWMIVSFIGWRIGLLKFHVRATDLGRQWGMRICTRDISNIGSLARILFTFSFFVWSSQMTWNCLFKCSLRYQIMVLELLFQSTFKKQTTNWSQHIKESMECQFLEIHAPSGLDLSKNTEYASQAALWGIEVST